MIDFFDIWGNSLLSRAPDGDRNLSLRLGFDFLADILVSISCYRGFSMSGAEDNKSSHAEVFVHLMMNSFTVYMYISSIDIITRRLVTLID